MYALVINDVVWDVSATNHYDSYSDVRQLPDDSPVQAGWIVDGGNYSPPPAPTPDYVAQAKYELDQNDDVAVRCFKAGVAYTQAWRDYDTALRSIADTGELPTGGFPARPDYPTGS